ncbi:hypothetical protein HQ865_24240 [Mucilaginibacter mali]|uniref:Uncharacterized protein n=1 Tax=Mucilaginibacter mali TaxID=2740462 RepID=A0A7D4UDR4_9SPHI|nr:hypothetical protein [Mucilaginibacter mali]QKJ32738.1 hypothetical protein HQ865_24240 [Mucilaginibacter mali]
MRSIRASLHNKIHNWIDTFGFRLNASQVDRKSNITTNHYFFETFNFFERKSQDHPERAQFLCFDTYGEKIKVKSLLDLQTAFFDNISQLK